MGQPNVTMGSTRSGPVRQCNDQSSPKIHVTLSGWTGDSSGRVSQPLAGHDSVRIPTNNNTRQGHDQDTTGEAKEVTLDRPTLANHDVVLQSEEFISINDVDSYERIGANSTTFGLRSPNAGLQLLSSVVHSVPRLSNLGYSDTVINQLNLARRPSTNLTYDSKWKLFAQFANDKNFDPFYASPALVAEFLLHIAKNRHVTTSTIAGYRAAIGRVLKLTTGYDPGKCEILSQLMQSFKRTQPVNAARIPCWNISFVLHVLSDPKNDNSLLSDKVLTAKAIFLTALASGDRRSAIAALSFDSVILTDNEMVIGYNKDFVPKSYFVKKNLTRIKPLKIPKIPDTRRCPVCPVRTLVDYVGLANKYRSESQTSFFTSHVQNRENNITSQSVSFYITFLVKWCYEQTNVSFPGCRAHDVRKIAASLRSLSVGSLHDVLEAGNWAQPMTFVKHYFLEFSKEESSNLSHFPNIIAGRKINPCSSLLQEKN